MDMNLDDDIGYVAPLFNLNRSYIYQVGDGLSVVVRTRTKSHVEYGDSSNELHIDDLWPGAKAASDYLKNNPKNCEGKYVLELGAGAALPSCVASKLNAKMVVITDYPNESVITNIENVVRSNKLSSTAVVPHNWGEDVSSVLHFSRDSKPSGKYQLIILAELLWKATYSLHDSLLKTVTSCLCRESGKAVVAFVHRVADGHSESNNLEFFAKATSAAYGLTCTYLGVNREYKDVDDGDEEDAVDFAENGLLTHSHSHPDQCILRVSHQVWCKL
jgi:predicted nicotinamide N-methyase